MGGTEVVVALALTAAGAAASAKQASGLEFAISPDQGDPARPARPGRRREYLRRRIPLPSPHSPRQTISLAQRRRDLSPRLVDPRHPPPGDPGGGILHPRLPGCPGSSGSPATPARGLWPWSQALCALRKPAPRRGHRAAHHRLVRPLPSMTPQRQSRRARGIFLRSRGNRRTA